MWTVESVRDTLQQNAIAISSESRLPNDMGWRFDCVGGEVICVYDTGKIVPQGKNQTAMKSLFGQGQPNPQGANTTQSIVPNNRNVFVVYGHDSTARTELEAMLRRWGLNPLILDQLTSGGQTIIEKLENAQKLANFAVVLATPDDEGFRAGQDGEKAFRARQNVVLELGMMLSILGRSRVAILLKDQVTMERPSDIQGLIYIPFKEDVKETALILAKEVHAKGISIDLTKI